MKVYLLYIICTLTGLVLMKLSEGSMAITVKDGIFGFSIGFKLLFAFIIYGISFLLWSGIVARNELTYIVPISSAIVNISTVVLGVLIFKEYLTLVQIIGIGITVIGVVLMNWK